MIRILDVSTYQDIVIEDIKRYSRQFDCKFVKSRADILFTNDFFLDEVRRVDMPRIKRVTHDDEDISSIQASDHVIFTTEELRDLYKDYAKSYSVIYDYETDKVKNLAMINSYYKVFEKYKT